MNQSLRDSFERLVCGNGHPLEWAGRWRHTGDQPHCWFPAIPPHATTAVFPRRYYKRSGEKGKTS